MSLPGLQPTLLMHFDAVNALFSAPRVALPLCKVKPSLSLLRIDHDNVTPADFEALVSSPLVLKHSSSEHLVWSLPLPDFDNSVLEDDDVFQVRDIHVCSMSPLSLKVSAFSAVCFDPAFPDCLSVLTSSSHPVPAAHIRIRFCVPLHLFLSVPPATLPTISSPSFSPIEQDLVFFTFVSPCFSYYRALRSSNGLGKFLR